MLRVCLNVFCLISDCMSLMQLFRYIRLMGVFLLGMFFLFVRKWLGLWLLFINLFMCKMVDWGVCSNCKYCLIIIRAWLEVVDGFRVVFLFRVVLLLLYMFVELMKINLGIFICIVIFIMVLIFLGYVFFILGLCCLLGGIFIKSRLVWKKLCRLLFFSLLLVCIRKGVMLDLVSVCSLLFVVVEFFMVQFDCVRVWLSGSFSQLQFNMEMVWIKVF